MKLKEIKDIIVKSLGIGQNYADFYMRKFNQLYTGSKRAIDGFSAKYSNAGQDVTFTITACGETTEHTFQVIKWSERKKSLIIKNTTS